MNSDISVVNGIQIIQDENDPNVIHFIPFEDNSNITARSWWQKLKDWWHNTDVSPYIKKRNLADPLNSQNEEYGNKNAIEVGIKVKF